MRRLVLGLYLVVVLGTVAPALAQQGTAQLGGKVVDAQGAVLPGVNIVVTNEDTGVFRELITGDEGIYFVSQLIPGPYRIAAKMEGFKALDRRGITLTVGQTTTLDLTLEVGGITETLTVTGEAPLVDVTSATVGGHISAQELVDLPAANRNYMAFVGNVPGTVFVPSAEFLNDSFQANGQPTAANNIVFDGANNTDEQRGSNVGGQTRAANESIQEVQVITNSFDAEWGRASGAVINAVTKSGTNQFTGSAFDFITSKAMTNKDFFTKLAGQDKPDVGKTEWGFTIGGPVVRNKLHFFVSVERLEAQRNWSNVFPLRPELNYATAGEESAWNTLWRIDHQLTPKHTWAFRWLREIAPQFNRLDGGQETLTSSNDETDLDQTLVATLTSVLTDTKVNTVRYGLVLEDTVHSNSAWRAFKPEYARCVPCPENAGLDQRLVAPVLDYDTFDIQAATTMDYSIQYGHSIDDTFSWFIPDAKGRHDLKFGARYSHVWLSNPNWGNMNGTYQFRQNQDPVFNVNNPRSFPERLTMRVPGPLDYEMIMHVGEFYAQDKWQMRPGLTLSAGVRYDLEVFPYDPKPLGNPQLTKYPVDRGNVAPRLGLVWNPDGQSKSVVRLGYGTFYDRTQLGTVDNFLTDYKYSPSFTANFPEAGADLGPRNGQYPTDPTLNVTRVDQISPAVRAYIDSIYPPGATVRNTGTVTWDSPNRQQPYFHQLSVGYEREVVTGLSVGVDYIKMKGKDMFFNPNMNIALGLNTVRGGPRLTPGPDPFGVLRPSLTPGEAMFTPNTTVRLLTTEYGYSDYDALNLSVEKRYSNNYSLRLAYSRGYSRGISAGQGDTPQLQTLTDLHIPEYDGPQGTDRKHNLVMSGRMEIPKTRGVTVSGMLRMLSGTPFTIQDDTLDLDLNRIDFQPLPAGTYSPFPTALPPTYGDTESKGGRNGARGPGFVQLDMRVGYRARLGGRRSLDIFAEMFNVADRANFTNPGGNRRVTADFLRLGGLVGGTGFPRQTQIGLRFGF
jgi:Carboxypeptidase regulatory-like domain